MSGRSDRPVVDGAALERSALVASMIVGLVLSAVGLALGLASGIRVLIFDGAYGVIGIALTWISLAAAAASVQSPNSRHPFGRVSLVPLAVVAQGFAALATIVVAGGDAVLVILDGGQRTDAVLVTVYSAATAIGSLIFAVWLQRRSGSSDLVAAEALAWRAGAVRGFVVSAGALVAVLLSALSFTALLDYIDPVLVLVSCALIVNFPIRLIRQGANELLEGPPSPEVTSSIDAIVAKGGERFALPAPSVRASKLGRRLYVEVTYLVPQNSWTVDREDELRRWLIAGLEQLDYDIWAAVEVTTDSTLAE